MKRTYKITYGFLFSVFLLLFWSSSSFCQNGAEYVKHKAQVNQQPPPYGDSCTGGEIHDDGTFEGGVGWASVTTEARFVIKFRPSIYPWQYNKFCIALGRVSYVTPDMRFSIVVYDTTGSGGSPGNPVYQIDSQYVNNIPVIPSYQFFSFSNLNIPPLLSGGAYYIGIRWNPSQNGYLKYSANDIDGIYWPGYYWSNFQPYWTPIEQGFPFGYRCLGYRTEGTVLIGITGNNHKIPSEYFLSQNYPNPFNPSTVIEYSLPKACYVVLKVFDILGREVETLVDEFKQAGNYSVNFYASDFATGIYYYTLISEDFSSTKKMLIIR